MSVKVKNNTKKITPDPFGFPDEEVVKESEFPDETTNHKYDISIELRREIAEKIVKEGESSGLEGMSLNKDGLGGKIMVAEGHYLDWNISSKGDFYTAGTIPTSDSSVDYLADAKDYSEVNNERTKIIALSRKAAQNEGVVGTALQALVELASLSGWWVDEPNDELRELLTWWLKNINAISEEEKTSNVIDESVTVESSGGIEKLIVTILYSILIDGDYVATETWENINIPVISAKRNVLTRLLQHDVMHIETDETLARMGKEVLYAEYDDEIINVVKDGSDGDKKKEALLLSIPDTIKEAIKAGNTKFPLPSKLTTHLSAKNNDLTAWGTPYLLRAFPALAFKHRLRALDNSTIQGLIQRLWIVKVGSDRPDSKLHIPDNKRVLLAVAALKKLKTHSLMVWGGSDISTEELKSSDSNVLSFKDRYASADDDIRQALGVTRALIDGTSDGKTSSDSTAFTKVEAQLERYQILVSRWINKKMRQIAIDNGYKDSFPEFNFMFLKLLSKDKVKNVIINTYEKNMMPLRRALYLMGHDGHKIVAELMAEKEEGLHEKLPIHNIPYTKQADPGRPDGTGDGEGDDGRNNNTSNPDSDRNGK